jgi:uncharacterized protein involved in tolerance to divalent cations
MQLQCLNQPLVATCHSCQIVIIYKWMNQLCLPEENKLIVYYKFS